MTKREWFEIQYANARDHHENWNGPLLEACWLAALIEAERVLRAMPYDVVTPDECADAIAALRSAK